MAASSAFAMYTSDLTMALHPQGNRSSCRGSIQLQEVQAFTSKSVDKTSVVTLRPAAFDGHQLNQEQLERAQLQPFLYGGCVNLSCLAADVPSSVAGIGAQLQQAIASCRVSNPLAASSMSYQASRINTLLSCFSEEVNNRWVAFLYDPAASAVEDTPCWFYVGLSHVRPCANSDLCACPRTGTPLVPLGNLWILTSCQLMYV